jgi:hypothetical protein
MKTWFYFNAVEGFGSYSVAIRAETRDLAIEDFRKKFPLATIASIATRKTMWE